MSCYSTISDGIAINCDDVNGSIGVEKDLYLINWDDFDRDATLDESTNVETTGDNIDGLTNIYINSGLSATDDVYTFEGTDYSVQPTVTAEVKEDGNTWFLHSILFTVYSKTSTARKVIEELGGSRVVAVVVDRSTGYHELFGADQGLKVSAVERAYVGTQNSNYYSVTLATPDIAVVRESTLGLMSTNGISVSS